MARVDNQRLVYEGVSLNIAVVNGCATYVDLDEPKVLAEGGETLEIWHADCEDGAEYTLTAYEGDATLAGADLSMDGPACFLATKRAPVDSVGLHAGSSYCVDAGESPVPDGRHRISRLDVSATDTVGVSIVVTTWDVA